MNESFEIKHASPKKGRGLFAIRDFEKGDLVIKGPVVLIPNKDFDLIHDTILYNYCYIWDDPNNNSEYYNAIALSECQFINHSYKPNTKYMYDYDNLCIEYIAIRKIKKGEEITVNYNGTSRDKSPVWFEVED